MTEQQEVHPRDLLGHRWGTPYRGHQTCQACGVPDTSSRVSELCLAADARLATEAEANAALTCGGCGGPHPFDTSVPSVRWNAVIRQAGLPEYLCLTCIVKAFAQCGESFTATLWGGEFNGLPIEVVINGKNATDAAAINEENTSLRAQLRWGAAGAETPAPQ